MACSGQASWNGMVSTSPFVFFLRSLGKVAVAVYGHKTLKVATR